MEKLIPLLNERHNLEWVLGSSKYNGDYLFVKGDKDNKFYEETIISKKFGFIKWLVENDKIDMKKHFYDKMNCVGYSDLNIVLCELAVSDNPIEFLAKILK